jgi:pimeloyl-ACP methyl ester carboxylesterase
VTTDPSVSPRVVEVDGATLYCEDRGVGPPVVLVHGGLVSSAMWEPVLPYLSDLRVITPDTRGHGRSTNADGVLSYARIADDVASLIEALGLVRPVVGGYSDGGQAVLEFGARHPGVARALIIGAALAKPVDAEMWRQFLGADERGRPDLAQVDASFGDAAEVLKAMHVGGEPQWRNLVMQIAPMWLDYAGLTDDEIQRIDTPALVFAGDRDDGVPLESLVTLHRALPTSELGICPGADHVWPLRSDRAAILGAMIRDFALRHS